MKLSVAIITCNEERIIEKTLSVIPAWADEIVIVDSYSNDKTEEICRKFPKVRFLQHKFSGFGAQKNFAINECRSEWILFLDADEIPDQTAFAHIQQILQEENSIFGAYKITFRNIFLGKTLQYGGWGNIQRERLFRKDSGKYSEDIVHEEFLTDAEVSELSGYINHYTYANIFHHIEKSNKYTTLMAEKMFLKGKKASLLKIIFKPWYQFVKSYFLRAGCLDGIPGFYLAITASFYTFLKYMKLYELNFIKKQK